ncbi:MAG: hypothetical protein ACLFP6_10960 [Spirochaetaceae bacterium]
MFESEKEISLPLTLPELGRAALDTLRGSWQVILALWVSTGLGALILQELLLPARIPSGEVGGEVVAVLLATTALTMLGLILLIRLVGGRATCGSREAAVHAFRGAMHRLDKALLTGLLSVARILLAILGSAPLVFLLGLLLYGAAQGTLSREVEMSLVAAPILLFAFIGVARFGWALFFSLLKSSGPVDSLKLSKALFQSNWRESSLFATVVVVVPLLAYLLPAYIHLPSPVIARLLAYLNSLWLFLATAAVSVAIARSEETGS